MWKYKELIKDFQSELLSKKIKNRDINFPNEILNLHKIITFVWSRRSWKTYFMFLILQKLIKEKKIKLEQIIFIDFSALLDNDFDIKELLVDFYEMNSDIEPFFVFDEIQELKNFSKTVLYIFNKNFKIFLSWSNSKLLSSELSTEFRWRTYDIKIFPLSFKEFLDFKDKSIWYTYTLKDIWTLKNTFLEYLKFWAYPEIVLINDENIKYDLIKSYFEIVLYKDLLERYWVSNEYVIKYLFKKLVLSNTKEFSTTKVFRELKSQNVKIWMQSLYNYLEYFKQIFFINEINDKYKKTSKKYYLNDVWFTNLVNKNNLWQRFENIVYLFLLRKFEYLFYIKNNFWEIDFIIEKYDLAIQTCHNLNIENFERELNLLNKLNYKNKILVYFDKSWNVSSNEINILDIFEFEKFILDLQLS